MNELSVCVVGASAGAFSSLQALTAGLPKNFPAAMLIIQHFPIDQRSVLSTLLGRKCVLPVSDAADDAPVLPGHVYVAVPNRHLVLEGRSMRLKFGPRINFVRPSIDALFRSATRSYHEHAIGIVLSGNLDDGVAGLMEIQRRGGKVIVQRPAEAHVPEMPENAIRNIKADFVAGVKEMAGLLMEIISRDPSTSGGHSEEEADSIKKVIADDLGEQEDQDRKGQMATFTCPECGGPLWQMDEPGRPAFACHIGHAISGHKLLESHDERVERTLWTTMRLLKEIQLLSNQLANNFRDQGLFREASQFESKSRFAAKQLEAYEQLLLTTADRPTEP